LAKIIDEIKLKNLKKIHKKQKIGLCHGAFDIVHLGHLEHFANAKKNCDILVVSITDDKYIKKGPFQPYNNSSKRLEFIKHLEQIDYVYLDSNPTAANVIKKLKPNFYFKGRDYLKKDLTDNLNKEIKILKKNKGKFIITKTDLASSTKIINNNFSDFSNDQKETIKKMNDLGGFDAIYKAFENIKTIELSIIGDPIIDGYKLCHLSGLTTKDPAISTILKEEKKISGGVIAVAKILSKFVKKVNLITYGDSKKLNWFTKKYKNIKIINLDQNIPIQEKIRYLNENRFEKLLQVANFKNISIEEKTVKKKIANSLKNKRNLIVCDFGVGLFTKKICELINKTKIKKFINTQTNSLNTGENLFTKYNQCEYMSLDLREWEIGMQEKLNNFNYSSIFKKFKSYKYIAITKGKNGSEFVSKKFSLSCPTFLKKTIDTTGCGDAYFAITSLMIMGNLTNHLNPFVGNIYAGMHGQFIGNEKTIDKISTLKYLKSLLNI
jgi:cytidyltransferase-like protein